MKFDQKEAFLYETYSRVEGVVGSDRATQVYAELSEHIDQLHEEYIERGLQPELAKRAALGAMGTPRSIATEFARTSISKPWRTWPLLVVILGVICYVILKDSPASGNYIESLYLVVPILFVGGFRNRVSLPFKPLLL
ncbi:MAG TPA: permease prefix domain 1-containing protein, partial [Fimbriimonas sp.]|nr:permease prefix domain 1-containing protein [Fimbriimonas sp.]